MYRTEWKVEIVSIGSLKATLQEICAEFKLKHIFNLGDKEFAVIAYRMTFVYPDGRVEIIN